MIRLDPTDHPTGKYQEMSDGLEGYWWETEKQVCIPWVFSHDPRAFLHFLKAQEAKGKAVVFPTIINARLAKLLLLRGYVPALIYVDYMHQDTDCLVLNPEKLILQEKP